MLKDYWDLTKNQDQVFILHAIFHLPRHQNSPGLCFMQLPTPRSLARLNLLTHNQNFQLGS
jgi:hypothetical protein